MRITRRIFTDLAIFMIMLGVIIGLAFPYFCLLLGVPKSLALSPLFFTACILAGISLGAMNILLARKTVGSRIRHISQKMKDVKDILIKRKQGISDTNCTADKCMVIVDSEDELGESADSFNQLIQTLADVLEAQSDLQQFSETLTTHLELDILANQALRYLIKITGANGGAILIENSGELKTEAVNAINDAKDLESNARVLFTMKTLERQLIKLPDDISLDGVIVNYHPRELLIEPIIFKQILIGIIILASVSPFTASGLDKLSFCRPTLSIAFNNAVNHNQMQRLAALDPLTSVYNRRFGVKRIQEEFSRSIRAGTPLSLLLLDIDHFKHVNDTYGHMVGDRVIVAIAKSIQGSIREGDLLVRYGGEEFLCGLPGANQKDAAIVAERIRVMIADLVVKHLAHELKVTVSIGTATYPNESIADINGLIKLSDEAMYAAKENGRNQVICR